jgi:hypothetical protein
VLAGAIGLKLHEDWGTTPAAIDVCLGVADELDVQVAIHTDTLNESGFVDDTIAAFKGRDDPYVPLGGRRWRARPRHHPRLRRTERAALVDQSNAALHR